MHGLAKMENEKSLALQGMCASWNLKHVLLQRNFKQSKIKAQRLKLKTQSSRFKAF